LLTVAFEIAARAKPTRRYSMSEMFREISIAAGSRRLIAGQVADLEAEGKKFRALNSVTSTKIKPLP
jgi:geranylgeranyl diphosphate synthase type II